MPDQKGAYSLADAKPVGQFSLADAKPVEINDAAPEAQSSIGGLLMAGANKAAPLIKQGVTVALDAPNAPRIIQRAIGAGVRGASTAAGAAIGGVPGAVAGAAMSQGLTPTQQTIRGWLGRTAESIAKAPVSETADAVDNYVKSMGGDVSNLTGAALEYAKKSGRSILYDSSGRAALVPSHVEPVINALTTAPPSVYKTILGALAKGLSMASVAQNALDVAQIAEPNRQDIGILGIGGNPTFPQRTMMVDGRPTLVKFNKDATKMTDSQGNDLAGKKITAMPGAK